MKIFKQTLSIIVLILVSCSNSIFLSRETSTTTISVELTRVSSMVSLPTNTLPPTPSSTETITEVSSYQTMAEFETALDTAIRTDTLDTFWDAIVAVGEMPLIFDQTAVFMYRGEANYVAWSADFAPGALWLMYMSGQRQGDSDLWVLKKDFPMDGRLSYRISINGDKKIILDPLNPYRNMEGSGPVSELRMPDYIPPTFTIPQEDIDHGLLSDDITLSSQVKSYKMNYRVYTPAGYEQMDSLSSIYVVDGQEYADDELGKMVIVLDNLIAEGKIEPVIAIFIDQRDPETGNNRRDNDFASASFEKFFVNELVPSIDTTYRTNPEPEKRAILGDSLGGLFAMKVGINNPDVFGLIAMQSASPELNSEDYEPISESGALLPLKFFISVGTIGDIYTPSRLLKKILMEKGYPLQYNEISDGHSWGHYRSQLDDMLVYFYGIEN